jgi:hypothetical protein
VLCGGSEWPRYSSRHLLLSPSAAMMRSAVMVSPVARVALGASKSMALTCAFSWTFYCQPQIQSNGGEEGANS